MIILVIVFMISGGYLISKSKLSKNAFDYHDLPNKFEVVLISSANEFDQEFRFSNTALFFPKKR